MGMGAIKVRLVVRGVKSRLTLVVASSTAVGSMRVVTVGRCGPPRW